MYCIKCGAWIDEEKQICKGCGEQYKDIAGRKQWLLEKFKVTDDESSKK